MLRLSKESVQGLQKLKSDILTLINKRNHSERTGDTTKFGFVDILKICIGTIVVIATIKIVIMILEW